MVLDIQLKNFSLAYQQQMLFQDLNFTIAGNACTCLLGPSGVGKSSLLHAIAGTQQTSSTQFSGSITASDQQSLTGRVMLMHQQDALLPWLNVLDNVLMGYRLRGSIDHAIKQQAEQLLDQVGIAKESWHKKPKALSGGMRQRVALVRTLLENKSVWLMDEPFSALDAITRYKLQDLAAQLWQDKTVLLVTHDPLEALRLGHHIYVMYGSPIKLFKIDLPEHLPPRHLTPELIVYQEKILELLK